jgi:hypothetical protein
VAAFCACCGAEITLKAEACPVCGNPQHGMLQPDLLPKSDVGVDPSQEEVKIGQNSPVSGSKSTAKLVQKA